MADTETYTRLNGPDGERPQNGRWNLSLYARLYAILRIVLNSLFRNIALTVLLILSVGVVLEVPVFRISLMILMTYLALLALASIFEGD